MAGITQQGFETETFSNIQSRLFSEAREDFGDDVDLSKASPLRHQIDSFALVISDKGLDNENIDALWPVLSDIFWSAYPSTATGTPLEYAAGFRGLTRQAAQKATGACTFSGASGTSIPVGTTVSTVSGIEFVTTRQDDIRDNGEVDIPCEAVETGGGSNVALNQITTVVDSVSADVTNKDASNTQTIGHVQSSWEAIPNDGTLDHYQVIPVSFLTHPIGLDAFELTVRNPQTSSQFFSIHLAIIDHATGDLIQQTEILDLDLNANEERTVSFSGQETDVATYSDIRVAIGNLELSDGDIEVAVDETEGFAQGQLYLDGVAQSVKDLTMTVTSKVDGNFDGGTGRETDVDLRKRYFEGLHMGGSARLAAIRSELQRVEGIKSSHVEENATGVDKSGSGGLPPHSVRATIYGGAVDDIADKLLQSRSAGVNLVGSRLEVVQDDDGQLHEIRFDRPTQKKIYVDISNLETDPREFPNDGHARIKDAVVEAIGGVDSEGVFHSGFGVGETVYHLSVAGAVKSVDGVRGGEVLLGTSQPADTEGRISVGAKEIAVTSPDNIRFL